ncbi:MAG TPA: glycosyltransferase family 2 protein [Edaphocola sp.]|nr:glycosyltransferase family 2 protein [Edaphocola sp.]
MSNKLLTIFTPTFNRAYCLHQVYESLLRQTNQNFKWLIIDDGSSDNTKELVASWQTENKIAIEYIYQENQGMHGAYNTAYHNIDTELNICIDSDDFMPDNAVALIEDFWKKNGSNKYSGLIGLDANTDGSIIGKRFPENLKASTLEDLYHKHKIPGDKKLVFRTEVVKNYPPYPLFKGENFVPHGVLFIMIDKDYELLCLNEPLVLVEYLADGSSRNMLKQYLRYPKGFLYSREVTLKYSKYWKVKLKNMIHLVSCHIQLKDWNIFRNNPYPILTLLLSPLGGLLYIYIKYKNKS